MLMLIITLIICNNSNNNNNDDNNNDATSMINNLNSMTTDINIIMFINMVIIITVNVYGSLSIW